MLRIGPLVICVGMILGLVVGALGPWRALLAVYVVAEGAAYRALPRCPECRTKLWYRRRGGCGRCAMWNS